MSTEKILHIAPDEKFINAANYIYEKAFPGRNTFYIIKPAANPPLKYVDLKGNFEVKVRSNELDNILFAAAQKYRIVVFHGLDRTMLELFKRSDNKEKFIWTFWGGEIYNSDLYSKPIFGPKTRVIENRLQKSKLLDYVKNIYRKIRYSHLEGREDVDKKKLLKEFKYIAKLNKNISVLKDSEILGQDCTMIPFTYYPLEFLFNDFQGRVDGDNILLGNSASTTNNHIEIIDLLTDLDLNGRKVITPLSYGNKEYASIIEKYGREKLGNSFYPLTEFVSLSEFHDLVRSCSIVIMNHYRPQGVGTSLASLYMGAKVFLNDTSFSEYLKEMGCYVYSINKELDLDPVNALKGLKPVEVEENRKILKRKISTKAVVNDLKSSFLKNFNFSGNEENLLT